MGDATRRAAPRRQRRALLAVAGAPVLLVTAIIAMAAGTPAVLPSCGGADATSTATLAAGSGRMVAASDYGGPADGGEHQSGSYVNDLFGHLAFAELSTNPQVADPARWDYAALGHLAPRTRLRISYGARSVVAEKLDQGRGGPGVQHAGRLYPRAIDLWYQTAAVLHFSGVDVVRLEPVDARGPLAVTSDAAAAAPRFNTARLAGFPPPLVAGIALGRPPAGPHLVHPHVVIEGGSTLDGAHFVVDADGTIAQARRLDRRAPAAGSLDRTAIVVNHADAGQGAGPSGLPIAQRDRSLALTRWLMARFSIPAHDVIGAGETAQSAYTRVRPGRAGSGGAAWSGPAMDGYRQALAPTVSSGGDPTAPPGVDTAGAACAPSAAAGTGPLSPGSRAQVLANGLATIPAAAPPAVQAMLAAGNRIVGKPYSQASPHGTPYTQILSHYDCSSSVSYLLFWGGVIRDPTQNFDSTALESWGRPGPGRWVTWWANADHVFAVVAGIRWDTHGAGPQPGIGWHLGTRDYAGFVERHPAGL